MNHKDYLLWIINHISPTDNQIHSPDSLSSNDWLNIFNIALEEGLAVYLYYCLRQLFSEIIIPEQINQKFVKASQNLIAKNTVIFHEMEKVLRTLNDNDIPVIVLKGAYLSTVIYPHNGLRPMGDIDLLVHKRDLKKVRTILLDMDYQQKIQLDIEMECERSRHLRPFINDKSVKIEIHWTITEKPDQLNELARNKYWDRAQSIRISNNDVYVFSAEYLIAYLCYHSYYCHFFKLGLKSFCDIAETLRHFQHEIDFNKLFSYSFELNSNRIVYTTLCVVSDLFGLRLPGNPMSKFKPEGFNQDRVDSVKGWILGEFDEVPSCDRNIANVWNNSKTGIGMLVYVSKRIFLSKLELSTKYNVPVNSVKIYIFHLVRIKDLFFQYSRSLFRVILNNTEMKKSIKTINKKSELEDWLSI
ncbi:MAG: nucleotidyltransferase family protein [Calditrichaeota bacterium]|jgi:hypothetical protein|nr:nucleotidyltransferase family protein [Calditrichota bacterium]MBT7618430.1 nucleotidyltransferase family protein [Calditrichota bacterium]MBT7789687.1 nucleotidyltransferase family protein [Calditrichota bacterium]